MVKKSVDIHIPTDPAWVKTALSDLNAFITDHANCERKASALCMSLVVRYPDRTAIIPTLIEIAQEELEHFRQVYCLMQGRKISVQADSPDPYIKQLMQLIRHGREERFMDDLLIASVVECRGAERFRLVFEYIEDKNLHTFYRDLWATEARHGHIFAEMAMQYFPQQSVYERLDELMQQEGKIIQALPWRNALH